MGSAVVPLVKRSRAIAIGSMAHGSAGSACSAAAIHSSSGTTVGPEGAEAVDEGRVGHDQRAVEPGEEGRQLLVAEAEVQRGQRDAGP